MLQTNELRKGRNPISERAHLALQHAAPPPRDASLVSSTPKSLIQVSSRPRKMCSIVSPARGYDLEPVPFKPSLQQGSTQRKNRVNKVLKGSRSWQPPKQFPQLPANGSHSRYTAVARLPPARLLPKHLKILRQRTNPVWLLVCPGAYVRSVLNGSTALD